MWRVVLVAFALHACFATTPKERECGSAVGPQCPSGSECITFRCQSVCTTSFNCAGSDACIDGLCVPYAATCDTVHDCRDGWFCGLGAACQKKLAAGEPCGDDDVRCQSGACTQEICCDQPCAGACVSCLGAHTGREDGHCLPITPGDDPHDECAGFDTCDGTGACYPGTLGSQCAGPEQCESGACVSGRCCDTSCEGPCVGCEEDAGHCAPTAAGRQVAACAPGYGCDGAGACVGDKSHQDAQALGSWTSDLQLAPGAEGEAWLFWQEPLGGKLARLSADGALVLRDLPIQGRATLAAAPTGEVVLVYAGETLASLAAEDGVSFSEGTLGAGALPFAAVAVTWHGHTASAAWCGTEGSIGVQSMRVGESWGAAALAEPVTEGECVGVWWGETEAQSVLVWWTRGAAHSELWGAQWTAQGLGPSELLARETVLEAAVSGAEVAWLSRDGGVVRVRHRRIQAPELTLRAATTVASATSAQKLLVASHTGRVAVLWQQPEGGNNQVFCTQDGGQGFGPPEPVAEVPGSAAQPRAAVDGLGNVHAYWLHVAEGARTVRYRRRHPQDGWQASQAVAGSAGAVGVATMRDALGNGLLLFAVEGETSSAYVSRFGP